MKTKTLLLKQLVLLVVLLTFNTLSAENLITNGDFEASTSADMAYPQHLLGKGDIDLSDLELKSTYDNFDIDAGVLEDIDNTGSISKILKISMNAGNSFTRLYIQPSTKVQGTSGKYFHINFWAKGKLGTRFTCFFKGTTGIQKTMSLSKDNIWENLDAYLEINTNSDFSLMIRMGENKTAPTVFYLDNILVEQVDSKITAITEKNTNAFSIIVNENIEIKNIIPNSNILILDSLGKIVYKKQANSNSINISKNIFEKGIYFIEIEKDGKKACSKIAIK